MTTEKQQLLDDMQNSKTLIELYANHEKIKIVVLEDQDYDLFKKALGILSDRGKEIIANL